MDYTKSSGHVVHPGTGRRMHQATGAIPTEVSDADLNSVIWSLMEVVQAGGQTGADFDPGVPSSYQRLRNAIQALAAEQVPVGTVIHGYFQVAPAGYVACMGQWVSRTEYFRLFQWVMNYATVLNDADWGAPGTRGHFASGDGATTFRLPDLTGQFIRGAGPGRLAGSWQADEIRSHTHTYTDNPILVPGGAEGGGRDAVGTAAAVTGATGGDETRPANVALVYCIRY